MNNNIEHTHTHTYVHHMWIPLLMYYVLKTQRCYYVSYCMYVQTSMLLTLKARYARMCTVRDSHWAHPKFVGTRYY